MTKAFSKYRPRILVFSGIVILLWAGISMRFFYVQIVKNNELKKKMAVQGVNKVARPAVRGIIYDRNHKPLAEDAIHYDFGVNPKQVEYKELIVSTFTNVTGKEPERFEKILNSNRPFEYLERNLNNSMSMPLLAIKDKGLVIKRHGYRSYPHHNITSQIIGFIDTDNIGLSGLERVYNDYLKGKDGWIIYQTDGKGQSTLDENYPHTEPVNGSDIILTIDLEYQAILRDEMSAQMKKLNASGAMGIIINPNSGTILAMSSLPDFDPHNRNIYPKQYYRNRVIEDQFEPGSTFKIVPATAALSLNTVSTTDEFYCEDGSYTFRGETIKDWSDFGLLTFPQIIEHSSNVGIIKIAETIGTKNLYTFAKKYGFGSATGIKLPGEASGTLRTPGDWSAISLARISLGHEISTTTLQLAYAYAAIANGGFLMKPILVDKIVNSSGKVIYTNSPQVVRKVASQREMEKLIQMLRRVVTSGTGTLANIKGWDVAGKTGTAQKYIDGAYSNSKFTSSFAGFLPANNPQLVMVVVMEEPDKGKHWGGTAAAPVFRETMKRILNIEDAILVHRPQNNDDNDNLLAYNISTTTSQSRSVALMKNAIVPISGEANNIVTVPDMRGKSQRNALSIIRELGLRPKVSGSGVVISQYPIPGKKVKINTVCNILLK